MISTKKAIKTIVSLILIIAMISCVWIGAGNAFIPGQSTVSPNANYVTFEGTAANDTYSSMQYSYVVNQWAMENELYSSPYAAWGNSSGAQLNPGDVWFNAGKSLRIGMTEFGEFADQGNTGIAYGANEAEFNNTESWASTAINQAYMVQGWVLYLNYSRFYIQRQLEAYALYSNTNTPESARQVYSWDGNTIFNTTTPTTVTAGSLTVSGIQVLYDSARLGVARETTVIKDGFYNEAVAQVTVTVIFDKTTKYAIVYYDVKIVLDPKVLIQINDFVFQKKYEIDLARNVNPSNAAFVHYYSNYGSSVYEDPLTGTYGYDIIQAYDPAYQYIFFDGIYPTATEYSVANPLVPVFTTPTTTADNQMTTKILLPLTATADIPAPIGEPNTPVITIQWNYTQAAYPNLMDFLAKSPNREIRFTDVFGMTDYNKDPHPAMDFNDTKTGTNQIDTEVLYLLSTVFRPIDLTTIAYSGEESLGDTGSPLWVAVGSGSAATDSAGAAAVSAMWLIHGAPLGLFDANDSTHLGSIPYGLSTYTNGSYAQYVNNKGAGTGNDATVYQEFGLINFAFGTYDNSTSLLTPQPVSGGFSKTYLATGDITPDNYFWYPSKSPLTERWIEDTAPSVTWHLGSFEGQTSEYDNVYWNPNGIITVGGEKANAITRYFNDFNFAIDREGTSSTDYAALIQHGVTGAAPTSSTTLQTVDFFPLSTWNTSSWNPITQASVPVNTFGYGPGTAIISVAIDINGTRGITVAGWNAEDTYWASAWASQWLNLVNNDWIPAGTVAIILQMSYANASSEPTFTIVQALGTITQFGTNYFTMHYIGSDVPVWSPIEALQGAPLPSATQTTPGYPFAEGNAWWYAKLPTKSTATIQYDS